MEQHIPVNERSFNGQATDLRMAGQLLHNLADTLRELISESRRRGMKYVIYSGDDLVNRPCAIINGEAQLFGQILFGRSIDRDIRVTLQILLSNNPYSQARLIRRTLQHNCTLVHSGEDATDSSIAAAAAFGGWLVSLKGCAAYPSGSLDLDYCEADDEHLPPPQRISLPHFNDHSTARSLRRRYIPNPKHHPNKFKGRIWEPVSERGSHSPMPLDVDYDPMVRDREQELRDPQRDPPDYRAQQLLDRAISIRNGRQLYACMQSPTGHIVFFEFQPDNSGGYHGYLVPAGTVPPQILQQLLEHTSESTR